MAKDPYETLGIEQDADDAEIRRAFRGLAKRHHPDQTGDDDAERFREIRDAYETLSERPAPTTAIPIRRGTTRTRPDRRPGVVPVDVPDAEPPRDDTLRLMLELLRFFGRV